MSPANTHYVLEEIEGSISSKLKESVWHFDSSWSNEPVTVRYTSHAEKIQLFRWYLEQHAANDPLNSSKARKAEAELAYVTEVLCGALPRLNTGSEPILLDILAKDQASTCHSIPWELLEGSALAAGRRIMIRRRTKCQSQQILQCPARVSETFNIAIIAARAEQQDEPYQQASLPLLHLLNDLPDGAPRVKIDVVRPGTFRGLRDYLKAASICNQKPHLIHFDVHGGLCKDSKRALLYFANHKTKSAEDLAELLKQHGVELAVLNACESARADRGLETNLAQTFAKAGLDAVLAMSYQFNASAVPTFVHDFYTQFLSRNLSFAEAAWSARCALRQKTYRRGRFGAQVKLQDWFVPVVYCSGDGDPVASASGRVNRVQKNQAILPSGAQTLKSNISDELQGRDKDVLQLETMLIENSRDGRGRLLCLEGKLGVGKTSLLRHVQWWWVSTGMVTNTIYFDMTNHQNKGPEEVCEAILKQIGNASNASQRSSRQGLCSFLSRGIEPSTTTPGISPPRTLLILDHFIVGKWPLPKKTLPTHDAFWAEWRAFLGMLSQSAAYTIVASYRWPWLLDEHETSEFPKETIHFLEPPRLRRADALMQIGSQANANALLANRQDQEHLDIVLKWCEPYPPLLPIIGPLVRAIGVAGVSEALTSGQDLFSYREFSRRAVEKLPPYDKAHRFWNAIPSSTKRQLISLAPFHKSMPRYAESYFRRFAQNDLERHISRQDFLHKYMANGAATKAARVQRLLPLYLEIASMNLVFINVLKDLGLIRAEVPTGSSNGAAGAEGTRIHSIHPIFSLFLRRQARKAGYLTKPKSKAPTKKSRCLEKTFVDYHEERANEWIRENETGALFWDYFVEMLTGKESFRTAMEIKLRRPFGTFEDERMPAFLYWCYKTMGEPIRAQTAMSLEYLAESAARALKYMCIGFRSLSCPEDCLTWLHEMMELYTWLAVYYFFGDFNREKFNLLITDADEIVAAYNEIRQRMIIGGFVFADHSDLQSILELRSILIPLETLRGCQAPIAISLGVTSPAQIHDASNNATAVTWGIIHRSVALFDHLSRISEQAFGLGYWDLQARVTDIDNIYADLDNILVDLAPDWPEFLSSLDSEMLATIRCLAFEDKDDDVVMPDITWDDVADMDHIALQPPNYASKFMAGIREGTSIAEAKAAFDRLWKEWLNKSSRAYGLALLDFYAQFENDAQRSYIENVSLLSLSLQGDWVSENELLDCLLIPERHCRLEDLSGTDFKRLARWHCQKAVNAYHLAAWDTCLEHLSTILRFALSRTELTRRVLFQALLQLVLLESAAPGKTPPTMSPSKALYYALLLAYSDKDDLIYAENGTLLSLLLQTASMEGYTSAMETILPIEHELILKEKGRVLGVASPQDILQRIEAMEKLRSTNGNLTLAREYLQRVQVLSTRAGANPRQILAEAEIHLLRHDRSCSCAFAQGSRRNSVREFASAEALVRLTTWPKFDLKAAFVPVVRPQISSVVLLTIMWIKNHFRPEPNYSLEQERELKLLEYLGRWHAFARDGRSSTVLRY